MTYSIRAYACGRDVRGCTSAEDLEAGNTELETVQKRNDGLVQEV